MIFKTQQEIWAHLANGGKVINKDNGEILFFKSEGYLNKGCSFACPENWSIYEEPKPKTVFYEYLVPHFVGESFSTRFYKSDSQFKTFWRNHPIIKTGRTIEVEL